MTHSHLPTLPSIRQQIDSIDEQIQQLINQRAECAKQVALIKRAEDPSIKSFYRPEREAQVLQMVMDGKRQPKIASMTAWQVKRLHVCFVKLCLHA